MRKLLKFAYSPKDPKVLVKYERQEPGMMPETVTMDSGDRPLPELVKSLARLERWLERLGELPDSWDLTVRGFTRTSTGGLMITGLRALEDSPAPMVINTPLVSELDGELEDVLEALEELVFRYVDGEREQLQLPFEDEATTPQAGREQI